MRFLKGHLILLSITYCLSVGYVKAQSSFLIADCDHPEREVFSRFEMRSNDQLGLSAQLFYEYASASLICADNIKSFVCVGFWNPAEAMERVEVRSNNFKSGKTVAEFSPPKAYRKDQEFLLCQRRRVQ